MYRTETKCCRKSSINNVYRIDLCIEHGIRRHVYDEIISEEPLKPFISISGFGFSTWVKIFPTIKETPKTLVRGSSIICFSVCGVRPSFKTYSAICGFRSLKTAAAQEKKTGNCSRQVRMLVSNTVHRL
jgi:hypothetical protein